jgi:hypothetical protein
LEFKKVNAPSDGDYVLLTAPLSVPRHVRASLDGLVLKWLRALDEPHFKRFVLRLYYDEGGRSTLGDDTRERMSRHDRVQLVKFKCDEKMRDEATGAHKPGVARLVSLHPLFDRMTPRPRCVCPVELHKMRTKEWATWATGVKHDVSVIHDLFDVPPFSFVDVSCSEEPMVVKPELTAFAVELPGVLWETLPETVPKCMLRGMEANRLLAMGPRSLGEPLYEDFHDDFAAIVLSALVQFVVKNKRARVNITSVYGDHRTLRDRLYSHIRWNGDRSGAVKNMCKIAHKPNSRELLKIIEAPNVRDAGDLIGKVRPWVGALGSMLMDSRVVQAIDGYKDGAPTLRRLVYEGDSAPTERRRSASRAISLRASNKPARRDLSSVRVSAPRRVRIVTAAASSFAGPAPARRSRARSASMDASEPNPPPFKHRDSIALTRYDAFRREKTRTSAIDGKKPPASLWAM